MMELLSVLALANLLGTALGQCNLYQQVVPGMTYDIKSPNYPNSYPNDIDCQWEAEARINSRLRLTCDVYMHPSSNCGGDHFNVSPINGKSIVFCNQTRFTVMSDRNRLNLMLHSALKSSGGKFYCTITAVECECGFKKQNRITGGEETGVNEYPMMAGLVDPERKLIFCGCTIIAPHFVLTAAHCFNDISLTINNVLILVGEHNISSSTETTATKLYQVAQFIKYPLYNETTLVHDIALVRTRTAIIMSSEVMPACLPFKYSSNSFTGEPVIILGWGTTEFAGFFSDVLLEAGVTVISTANCQQYYGNRASDAHLCTYGDGRDACQADSGGPVLWQEGSSQRLFLLATISNGIGCGSNSPGVNTRVTAYLSWITTVMTGELYCTR